MKYDADIFTEQFPIVKDFLYHLTFYRELRSACQEFRPQSEFWSYTVNAHILQACISWCMVFGANANPTHWKKLCNEDEKLLEDCFRVGLFKKTKLTQEEWHEYWKHMNDFRGGYAAHRELNYSKPVPYFNIAESVAYFYDEWIRKLIYPDTFEEPPLQESVLKIKKEIRPLVLPCLRQS